MKSILTKCNPYFNWLFKSYRNEDMILKKYELLMSIDFFGNAIVLMLL